MYTSNLLNPKRKMSCKTTSKEIEGIRVIYFNSLFNYHWDAFAPEVFEYCKKELRKYDLIHVYGYRDLFSTVVCHYARRWDIPYVFEPMGMFIPIGRSYGKKKAYGLLFGQRLTKGAKKIIATSEQEKEELLSCSIQKGRIFLRRNGLDLSEFENLPVKGGFRAHNKLSENDQVLLFLGRIVRRKGVDLLIRAFAELNLPKAKLIIVGPDGGDGCLKEVVKLTKELRLEERVLFSGPLYGKEKIQAFVDADVFVLASQYGENFGNTVAEAVACGTPVIITARCGIAPYIRERVGLVIKHDKEELKIAIKRVLLDKELKERFAKNAPKVKNELSWDEPVNRLEELYENIVKIEE